jgi:RHS repeat-associated protein
VQTRQQNHTGGEDVASSDIDWAGRGLQSKLTTTAHGKTTQVHTTSSYGAAGQALMSCQRIDGGKKEPVARYSYNALGEVISKVQGCNQQTLTFETDIRGRLLKMNSSDPAVLRTKKQFFGFGLTYTLDDNIARQDWASQSGLKSSDAAGTSHHYAYAYDGLQRLQTAHYNGDANHAYSVTGMAYDGNGNIKALTRPGVDNLSYRYKAGSNTLLEVSDGSDATRGFNDAHTGTDYEYDLAGNLTVDRNRGITNISYNALGLAESITFGNGTIRYVYSGGGDKLRKEGAFVPTNNVPSPTPSVGQQTLDYVAGLLYTDNALSHVPTGEGRALPPLSQLGSEWRYEYQQQDHLGNLRSACRCGEQVNASTGAVEPLVGAEPRVLVQSGHYDPWGLNLADLETKTGKGVDLWQFTGQERDYQGYTEFKMRQYDPAVGRFMSVDPMADAFGWVSPFNYAENSPIANIDLYGLQKESVVNPRTYIPSTRPELPSIGGSAGSGFNLSGVIASGIARAASTAMPKPATPTIGYKPIDVPQSYVGSGTVKSAWTQQRNKEAEAIYSRQQAVRNFGYGIGNGTLGDILQPVTRPLANGGLNAYYNHLYRPDLSRTANLALDGMKPAAGIAVGILTEGVVTGIAVEGFMTGPILVNERTIANSLKGSNMKTLQTEVSMPVVEHYVRMLEAGDISPSINVAEGVIVDGNHRYVAGRVFGREPSQRPYIISPSQRSRIQPIQKIKVSRIDYGNR